MATMVNKVEMNLDDYNQMKKQLDLYEEIFDAITTPWVSEWDKEWMKDHPEYEHVIGTGNILDSRMPKKCKDYLVNAINLKLEKFVLMNGLPVEFNVGEIVVPLCRAKTIVEDTPESAE